MFMWLVIEQDVSELTCESATARLGPPRDSKTRPPRRRRHRRRPVKQFYRKYCAQPWTLYDKNQITRLYNEDRITVDGYQRSEMRRCYMLILITSSL